MLVAFEAGGLIRALILFLFYPFIALCNDDFAIKAMVMICFLGLKKDKFREGRAVLPKFFLEDVGKESFEVLRRCKKKVAITDLPRVMVEVFLIDYLDIDIVVGRELKVFCGYYVGLMEERSDINSFQVVDSSSNSIGISSFKKFFDCPLFFNCKEIYLVTEKEKRDWHQLPKDLYHKPLVFHDGRLAFTPTYLATLAMFMWLPFGFILAIFRIIIAMPSSYPMYYLVMHFTGLRLRGFKPNNIVSSSNEKKNGVLYVCNHRTLLDPVIVSLILNDPSLTALTYSVSKVSEKLSPIKTVRLTRNKDQDAELMHESLSQGDLVVCPEGTTCREPYLLRFSPLFSEISERIVPVAMDCHVSMFYGTTARGFKCLDPFFFLMNPYPSYSAHFLDMVRGGVNESIDDCENLKFKVANLVQSEIAKELGFSCTKLTRKDKYLILAGNAGIVS
ncbi:hypothetical protein RD792_018035 [Penstemon davidsonii]|uniref:Phospholipid/glycerol acyltransferase domain-containing protein n=1 Tax=Penstemon davidsonii TaxID=160366 RepID=A0ABR0DVA4_9LAMI|nr:hypothetical protein RD792_018035 [Penstemon davidsonii]